MTTYYCKCGRIDRKSTNADNTGHRMEGYAPGHECFGCPYVIPWGKEQYEDGKGWYLDIKGYECRMSKALEYASHFFGSFSDKRTCSIVSLDFDFLERVSNWIAENYPGGELNGRFDRNEIRPVEYSSNGRYRLTVSCSQNKAGMSAKDALLERFFYPDGSRKNMTPGQEKEKILNDIKAAIHKEAAPCAANNPNQSPTPTAAPSQGPSPVTARGASIETTAPGGQTEQAATCKCVTCTCDGCHEECFGHCHGCGKPVRSCNSYQTEGTKNLARPAYAGTASLEAEPGRPAFDYSGLDVQTVEDLHLAEREYKGGKHLVETGLRRMADGVAIAHDVLVANCDKHNNQHSEDNFRRFCADVLGISKDAAYRLLQVNKMFCNSSPKEQKILEVLSPSLLYAAAKPSAPAELVQSVKDGDITTLKQYKEMQARAEAAEAQRDAALKERDEAKAAKSRAEEIAADAKNKAQESYAREENARAAAHHYHVQAEEEAAERNALLDRQAEYIRAAIEKDARIRELESRPVEVVGATPEDIARWRAEGAEQARKETQKELRRANAETAKERKRADEAERDRDECADTMEKYATQLGELRGRQEMTDEQLHAIYTAEKAAETCTMVICQALGEIYNLPRDLKAQAMNHLQNLHICLGKAISLGYWPTDEDLQDELDEPDEWPEEDEDV